MDKTAVRDKVITGKILKEIDDINKFIERLTEEEFYHDVKTQKAVVMSLINIGELSKSYTDEFMSRNKQIPWKKVQAMRNVAAHKYDIVDMEIVWDTIQISMEELKKALIK